jgi:hypothetical protein
VVILLCSLTCMFNSPFQPGVPMHSTTSFSMNGKEGRGDTSVWTDTPLERAQKAQQK